MINNNHHYYQVKLFWSRAIQDPNYCRIFCLVHAEKLTNVASDNAVNSLSELTQGQKCRQLVLLGLDIELCS